MPGSRPGAIERARDGHALSREELTALFAERRPEVIEDMRLAADELRARLAGDTATFVVNRNINFTNVCQVGLRVLRVRPGPPLAGRIPRDGG